MADKNKLDNIYKTIVEHLGEEIFVCDGEGNVLFVNPASIEISEFETQDVIGRNMRDLMAEGYFSQSSTLTVLRERKPVSILQTTKSGNQVIATGIPIFDEKGNIELVITSSQDIHAVDKLLDTLDKQRQEIETLRRELSKSSEIDVTDPASLKIKDSLEKVASLDIPLLIYGESGTGKQVAARHVHFYSNRSEKPFVTVTCTDSDEEYLDKEIFGAEDSSLNGERRNIKQGKLDYANEGTLVINNISHLPMRLQSKLFNYIDKGTFTRYGGSQEVKSSARIIAVTGSDLKSMSKSGEFMKSLYYKLDTVPLSIPPLRNRIRDIPYLANQYISKYNAKYNAKKIFNKDALGVLTSHTWPGNLIELDKTVESAYIMSDGPVIKGSTVYDVIHGSTEQEESKYKVYCEDIIPLKEAKHQLEEQLVKRAYEIYKTTYKTAEALGVNQSTVSRILKKY
ncbi:MAG: sigma 54-interacting transcriptional regulator [Firmicutes bacterium]|nr:sigma 54-interacting transcriptional regulator [Bacillota bacterium]